MTHKIEVAREGQWTVYPTLGMWAGPAGRIHVTYPAVKIDPMFEQGDHLSFGPNDDCCERCTRMFDWALSVLRSEDRYRPL